MAFNGVLVKNAYRQQKERELSNYTQEECKK